MPLSPRALATCITTLALAGAASADRATKGLQVLYDFQSPSGDIIKDRAGAGKPIDLKIDKMQGVRRAKGALEVRGDTIVRSGKPAQRLTEAIKRSGELTVEAWVKPENNKQDGPARIVLHLAR